MISIKEMLHSAWTVFKKHALVLIGATLVIGVVSAISGRTDSLIQLILVLVMWWLQIGLWRMILGAHNGAPVRINDLITGKPMTLLHFAIASILSGLIVGVGLILLIVPGVIAMTGLVFAQLFVVDKGMKGIAAMKASWALTKGHRWELFLALLVLLLVNVFVAFVTFGFGLLVTMPISMLAIAYLYRKLDRGIQPAAPASPAEAVPHIA